MNRHTSNTRDEGHTAASWLSCRSIRTLASAAANAPFARSPGSRRITHRLRYQSILCPSALYAALIVIPHRCDSSGRPVATQAAASVLDALPAPTERPTAPATEMAFNGDLNCAGEEPLLGMVI